VIPVHSFMFPKIGDRVQRVERSGLFEVTDINVTSRTVSLKSADGEGLLSRYVPWTELKPQSASCSGCCEATREHPAGAEIKDNS
jgi:hypothetical protein